LAQLSSYENVREVALVSTCLRTEVYAVVDAFHGGLSAIGQVLAEHSGMPMGDLTKYAYVRYSEAAFEALSADADAVVLVHQYRPAVDRWLLEIPAGTCDVDAEPSEETARRELAEEVGLRADRLELMTRTVITPGFCDEFTDVYLATGLHPVPSDRQGAEERFMEVVEVPLARFDAMVDDGTVIGIAFQSMAHIRGKRVGFAKPRSAAASLPSFR